MRKYYQGLILISFFFVFSSTFGQTTIKGKVEDEGTKEPLVGVNIVIKGKLAGTITDVKGEFELHSESAPPFVLVFSYVGYESQEVEVNNQSEINVGLKEQVILGQEVVISASRVEENILKSPVTVEKLGIMDIRSNAAADFYDKIGELKGVDLNKQSFTFKVPNTRGFNGNTNYRVNQIVDGIDNAPPGLSFAAGNIFGLSQLDVESVELLVGASSALYGPGGLNGTILMTSKNPFEYQGLSAYVQTGVNNVAAPDLDWPTPMGNANIRFAKAWNNKFAVKFVTSYIQAHDWEGSDYRDRNDLNNPGLNRKTNAAYDGVNVYGDEAIVPVNLKDVAPSVGANIADSQGLTPGTPEYDAVVQNIVDLFPDQVVTRTGYDEKDLVDYNTRNFRFQSSLHYRINDNLEASLSGGYGNGTAVYTAQNRFSLRDFKIVQGKLELKSKNFFVRTWAVKEYSGETFDAGATAQLINEAWKPSQDWYTDFIGTFTANYLFGNPLENSLNFARNVADNRNNQGTILDPSKPARPLPGSPEFQTLFDDITSKTVDQGGSKIIDKTSMVNFEFMYDFKDKIQFADILVGGSERIYRIYSEGTIFFDKPGEPIIQNQMGAYGQISKELINHKLKFTGSVRYDKNEKFDGRITPRGSFVYSFGKDGQNNFRGSVQTAFRFASVSDQWVDLNVGPFKVVGGLPEVQQKYGFDTNPVYPLEGSNTLDSQPDLSNGPYKIPKFSPERVIAYEIGYKGLFLDGKILMDAYGYYNKFNGFQATQNLVMDPGTPNEKRFQTFITTDDPVSSYGWALGIDYKLNRGYFLRGNIASNKLEHLGNRPVGFESRFNSPPYRTNISFSNMEVYRNMGFSVNWRWQNKFLWESTFGVGEVPAYQTFDAMVSFKLQNLHSILKVGGSNLLNKYYTTGFGNPAIGALYYISVTFDELMN